MRPLWLELQNIGPFVKKTRLDLERIEEGGLFLISGPTGSGKSFIFDTICYSLYGKTPSKREGHMRSHHSGIGDKPVIKFSFKVGDQTYLIERTLEYEDRKRGSGTTMRPEGASLLRLIQDPSAVDGIRSDPLASKKTEVHDRCVEILGLGMEQFSRVMMIPQGEFRDLLRSETKDREALLRKLFDSILYLRIADELSAMYGKLNDEMKAGTERNNALTDNIAANLGVDVKPGDGLTFDEWSKDILGRIKDGLEDSKLKEEGARKKWEGARSALLRAKEVFQTSDDLDDTRKRIKKLETEEKEKISGYENTLDLSARSSRLEPDLRIHDGLISERADTGNTVSTLESGLKRIEASHSEIKLMEEEKIPLLEAKLNDLQTSRKTLESSTPLIIDIGRIIKESKAIREDLKPKEAGHNLLIRERKGLETRFIVIKEEMKGQPVRENIGRLTIVIKNGRDLLKILERNESVRSEIDRLEGSRMDLEKILKNEMSGLSNLRRGREASMAAELARDLREGVECPVCGSLDHPRPKGPSDENVTPEMIDAVESSIEKRRKELSKIIGDLTRSSTMSEELRKRSKEILDDTQELADIEPGGFEDKLKDLEKVEADEKDRIERKTRLEGEMDGISSRMTEIDRSVEPLTDDINDLKMRTASLDSRIEERSDRMKEIGIDTASGDPQRELDGRLMDIDDRSTKLSDEISDIRKISRQSEGELVRCRENLSSGKENLRKINGKITDVVGKLDGGIGSIDGIDTIEGLRKAILPEAEELELKEAVRDYRDKWKRLTGTAQDLDKKLRSYDMEVPGKESLERMSSEEAELEEIWKSIHASKSRLEETLTRTNRQIDDIRRSKEKMRDKEKLRSVVGKLAKEVKGNSNPRISLERFFLSQRFEEVLISSNYRMKILSGGRFLLRRAADEDRGARSRGGLDLNVYDNYTGQERPANTLSGGQMFLASLSLALGLADVVQSRSGGIRMDALFIDEGFGSLDEETLQTALKVLTELRKGRMVGVISHVPELKRQIRDVIEITAGREGSTISMATR